MNADRDDAVATVATKHQTAADVALTLPRTPMVGVSRFFDFRLSVSVRFSLLTPLSDFRASAPARSPPCARKPCGGERGGPGREETRLKQPEGQTIPRRDGEDGQTAI